ncbi:MAG: SIP domain-containing protein [Acidimicrobiales bacterium]|nr:SIP domain-containing protein [Acidimicrobiales bacterium]
MTTEIEEPPIVAYLAVEEKSIIERFNADFADTVLMVTRNLGGFPEATDCELVGIDPEGLDSKVTDPAGVHDLRLDFNIPVEVPDHLTSALFDLIERARDASGDTGQTSAEREAAALAAIGTHLTEVVAVSDVHPHLRQITFGGGDLATTFDPVGPDCFFYVLLPPPGRTELGIDQTFTWEAHARMPVEDQPVGAYYTLRAWRPEKAELDIWMVLHGEGDHAGPASSWAARAQVGDKVALWGPRTAFHPPDGTDHLVLVGDETGLPAIAGIIDWMPDGMTATVLAEVAEESERQELPSRAGVDVIWLHREGAEAGTTSLLADAARALPPLPESTYVWGGGESKAMTAVRRHVRNDRGLDRESVALVAYWRHKATTDADVDSE